jgi:hypothetical protein
MAKKNEAIESREIKHKEVLWSITIQGADGNAYRFALLHSPGEPPCEIVIANQAPDYEEVRFSADLDSIQLLTAWFAKAVVRARKFEADHPRS